MSIKQNPVEWFSSQIMKHDNISVELWNSIFEEANEKFKDEIYAAFEYGKECGIDIGKSDLKNEDCFCFTDGMQYYENRFDSI